MSPAAPFVLTWQLRERMHARGMTHIVDLEKALQAIGVKISAVQLGRMVQHPPKHLPMDLLPALLNVLDCGPADLLVWRPAQTTDTRTHVPLVRGPRRKIREAKPIEHAEAERAALVGPPLHGLPAKTLKTGSMP